MHTTTYKLLPRRCVLSWDFRLVVCFCDVESERQHTELELELNLACLPRKTNAPACNRSIALGTERTSRGNRDATQQFQQLLKPEKAPSSFSSPLAPPESAAENAEVAAKDGGFEPITTRVSPSGEGVRKDEKRQKGGGRGTTLPSVKFFE